MRVLRSPSREKLHSLSGRGKRLGWQRRKRLLKINKPQKSVEDLHLRPMRFHHLVPPNSTLKISSKRNKSERRELKRQLRQAWTLPRCQIVWNKPRNNSSPSRVKWQHSRPASTLTSPRSTSPRRLPNSRRCRRSSKRDSTSQRAK